MTKVFVLRNIVTDEQSPLMLSPNPVIAGRTAGAALAKVPYKDEFRLYEIGSYNPENLSVEPIGIPIEYPILDKDVADVD